MKWSKAFSIGKSKQEDGQYKEAIRYFNKALVIAARSNRSKQEEAWTHYGLAELYLSIEKYHEAVDYYQKGLSIVQETGDKKLEWQMCSGLGEAYSKLGQYNDYMKYSKQAFDIALRTGDSELIAKSYLYLGSAYGFLYEYQNSMKCYNKAINMCKQLGNESVLAKCYANLSVSYDKQGKYNNAIHFQEESLRICDNLGDKEGKASSLLNLGAIHGKLNNFEKAIDFYKQSLTIAEDMSYKGLQGHCYGNLGNVLSDCGDKQGAIPYYLKSLTIAEQLDDKQLQADVNMNIGNCFKDMELYKKANEFYDNSLIIAKEIKEKATESMIYCNRADLHFNIGEFPEAISMSEQSLDIALSIGNKEWEGKACYLLGETYHSLAKDNEEHGHETDVSYMAKSEKYLRKALDCCDYLFSQLHYHDQFKISIFDKFMRAYKLLTTVYIETQQTKQALLVSTRERARALGDCLTFKYDMSQVEYLTSKPLTYPDVENVLSNDAFTLLHYSLLKECLAVWVLTKDSLTFKQTDKEQFDSAVEEDTISLFFTDTVSRAFKDMQIKEGVTCENRSLDDCVTLKDQQRGGVTESLPQGNTSVEEPGQDSHPLEELYNALIAPVLSHVQHDEIVIVPDGKMYTVPFAALIDPNTGQYLSETKRIRLVPSIAILKVLQKCPIDHHSQQGALIEGNPSVGEVMFRGKKREFEDLFSANIEVNCIANLLNHASKTTTKANITSLKGTEATKDVVLSKLKEGVAIIHIAAHGSPDNGEIALAPIASQDRQGIPEEEDYLLTMKEVQQVGIKAQLVVLSCCHSGRGRIQAEGVVGLSRTFLAAGARAVVASLWAIDDSVTLSFMISFYECLCRGESASVSLDKAMKEIRKEYSEPKYWAPFFLIGDDVSIKFGR